MWKRRRTRKVTVGPLEPRNPWAKLERPNVNDCYGVLDGAIWIWTAVGIFPFTLTETKSRKREKRYEISTSRATYSILVFFVCFLNFLYSTTKYNSLWSSEEMSRAYSSILTRTTASTICMFVSTITRIYRRKEFALIIESIAAQEEFLRKMGCRLKYGKNARVIQLYVWGTALITAGFMAYDYCFISPFIDRQSLRWLIWILPFEAQILDLTMLVTLVALVSFEFQAVNEKIKNIAIRVNAPSPKIVVDTYDSVEQLRLVSKAHFNICAVGKRINNFFSLDLIINTATAVTILSITLYDIYIEFQRRHVPDYHRIASYVHWEVIHSFPLIMIVFTFNWTAREGAYAGQLIHEIRLERANLELYETLKSFSLQMYHQKLEFTAGGLYPVNSRYLQEIISQVTMYLVINIQFQPKYYLDDYPQTAEDTEDTEYTEYTKYKAAP